MTLGQKECHFTVFNHFFEANEETIELYYPSLRRLDEYARVAALLRWARRPGNLIGIDFSDLAGVDASSSQYRIPYALTTR